MGIWESGETAPASPLSFANPKSNNFVPDFVTNLGCRADGTDDVFFFLRRKRIEKGRVEGIEKSSEVAVSRVRASAWQLCAPI